MPSGYKARTARPTAAVRYHVGSWTALCITTRAPAWEFSIGS